MVGGGGGGFENNPLKPPRFGCVTAGINIFRSNFCEVYYKLNKLEHYLKCL